MSLFRRSAREANPTGKPRPPVFRALGANEPPAEIKVDGAVYLRSNIFKHDSWAATAVYEREDHKIVVKFNRQQSVFGLPMSWLGRFLASREHRMLCLLKDVQNVPLPCGQISVDGRDCRTAAGHDYIEGEPLRPGKQVEDKFFDQFRSLLQQLHERDIAYVDLHKCENVLVGSNDEPYLIDFQISVKLPRVWPLSWLLSMLMQSDDYHLAKQVHFFRPDQSTQSFTDGSARPWWIRAHRCVAVPFRQFRRRLLVMIGVRKGTGHAATEFAPEDGKQPIISS